jgi:prefoldin subunit 5
MSIELEDLNTERERLETDRKTLLENLNELQTQIGKVQTQIQAISGAVQTCDYFINKIQQPPQEPELENEDKEAGDGKNKGK